jgi:MinD-like ATPase involved in chromosome partitioning or flagellar assembly
MTGSGRLAVLVAVDDEPSAVALLATLEAEPTVVVARRCVDVADLVGAAAAGIGRVALVSSGLRQLDGGMLDRLRQADVGIVGVVPAAGDPEAGERRLRQLGVARVVGAGVGRPELTTVLRAAAAGIQPPGDPGRPAGVGPARIPAPQTPAPEESAHAPWPEEGQVVAVWGPAGAPGRTSLAVNVAAELATGTGATLLVDADTYAASIAQLLGMLEEAPGIAAAARLADAGTLDVPALAGCARDLGGGLLVLTGLPRADRWPEVRGPAAGVVLSRARALARWTVVDCGFCLEDDEELSYDTVAPRRNAVTLAVLEEADVVLVVGAAEPVGIARLLRGLAELRAAVPGATPLVVLNKVRGGGPAGAVARDAATLLARHAGVTPVATVPYDGPAFDAALAAGRTLAESGNAGPARAAIGELARLLTLRAAAPAPAPVRPAGDTVPTMRG